MLKPNIPWKNMQCWKLSKNEGYKNPMIEGKIRRPIRAQNSGSHALNSPSAGATDLGQGRNTHSHHRGPTSQHLSQSCGHQEPTSGWQIPLVSRTRVKSTNLLLRHGKSPLVLKVGSRCKTSSSQPCLPWFPHIIMRGGSSIGDTPQVAHQLISLFISPQASGVQAEVASLWVPEVAQESWYGFSSYFPL